jgi:hypothetical protein
MAWALAALMVATPVFAQEGNVPQRTLSSLGLGDLEGMSDADGMEIRGQAATAMAIGTSLVFGQLVSPDTKNFVAGSDVNMVQASDDRIGSDAYAAKEHLSTIQLQLGPIDVDGTEIFFGQLFGIAGGVGAAGTNPGDFFEIGFPFTTNRVSY